MRPPAGVAQLLASAESILSDVEQSDIMKNTERREYPTFSSGDLKMGAVLGIGGFGIVSEVAAIEFQRHDENNKKEKDAAATAIADQEDSSNDNKYPVASAAPVEQALLVDQDHEHAEQHFDVETAKHKMAKECMRLGKARYAIKRLDPLLSDMERTRGMIDMALEVKYLSVLWHPNIVKMRGISAGDRLTPDAFFVMDRLYETLDKRITSWSKAKRACSGVLGFGGDKPAKRHLLVERLIVAYDLAVAFSYIHDNKLVYRDIKQENFGFDVRGDIKVFDFGLTKALLPSLKVKRSRFYRLTPITGSLPYMAPEVALKKPYNCSCDCFSFAFLLYELLALKKTPYHCYAPREYFERVVKGNERPTINRNWPELSMGLLKDSWKKDPEQRPSMKNICKAIREDLNELSDEEDVVNRTRHMLNRSNRSVELAATAQQ